jgi:cytochrome c oxidase cbb3-type subunit 2
MALQSKRFTWQGRLARESFTPHVIVATLCLLSGWLLTGNLRSEAQDIESVRKQQTAELLRLGKLVYQRYCVGCHGEKGDGKGKAARFLFPKPRDFTSGLFKFRMTPSGSLPTDEDLYRVITRGINRSAMPSFVLVPEKERVAVIQYLKSFSEAWKYREPEPPISIPNPPEWLGSSESAAKGKEIYQRMECFKCHGQKGEGDPKADLTDNWGNKIKPYDFRKGVLKGGPTIKDIYRTFTTGLNGTPMPAYSADLNEEERWHIVSYVLSLRGEKKSQ